MLLSLSAPALRVMVTGVRPSCLELGEPPVCLCTSTQPHSHLHLDRQFSIGKQPNRHDSVWAEGDRRTDRHTDSLTNEEPVEETCENNFLLKWRLCESNQSNEITQPSSTVHTTAPPCLSEPPRYWNIRVIDKWQRRLRDETRKTESEKLETCRYLWKSTRSET